MPVLDVLVCGKCKKQFDLSDFNSYINHKRFDCNESLSKWSANERIYCQSCQEVFQSPWNLIVHAQTKHSLQIFTTSPVRQDQSESSNDTQTSDIGVQTGCCGADCQPRRLRSGTRLFVEEPRTCCCDNRECGVTVLPGTHERPRKCCSAVVPKKRKRHMETKHIVKKKTFGKSQIQQQDNSHNVAIQTDASNTDDMTFSHDALVDSLLADVDVSSLGQPFSNIPQKSFPSLSIMSELMPVTSSESNAAGTQVSVVPTLNSPDKIQSYNSLSTNITDLESDLFSKFSYNSGSGLSDIINTDNQLNASQWSSVGSDTYQDNIPKVPDESTLPFTTDSAVSVATDGIGEVIKLDRQKKKRRTYPTTRPFRCDQCDRGFNQKIHLIKHQSKHTGIKPYKCGECNYSTVERSHLKVHERVHTGEKPFACEHCDYTTAQNSTLKIHIKRHHHQHAD